MTDIAPDLLEKIKAGFDAEMSASKKIASLVEEINSGSATYQESLQYGEEVGNILSRVLTENISSSVLPDGKMYFNIAQRILQPVMENNYNLISEIAQTVQQSMNDSSGIGLKAQKAVLNQDKIDGIINRVSSEDSFDDVSWIFGEPVTNFSMSIVDDTLKQNVEFQGKAGIYPDIVRKSSYKCCEWCSKIEGSYNWPNIPDDIYRRHDNCRCVVDYLGNGVRESVHTGTEGKRKYVQDKYGDYVMTKEARINRVTEMQKTEAARKEAARQKRIETWAKKKEAQS